MINLICKSLAALLVLTISATSHEDLEDAVADAQAADIRSDADRARDANRKPAATLAFFRLRQDMRVLELLPGGGWYTRILAPLLYDDGELFVSIGTDGIKENLLGAPGFDRVQVIEAEGEFTRVGRYFEGLSFQAEGMDLVLTFRNLHNFTPDGRAAINASAFAAQPDPRRRRGCTGPRCRAALHRARWLQVRGADRLRSARIGGLDDP